ncbi:MAG TPA: NAD(P)/FAD-dependent oxidoreductase [Rhizomicrobium sp.]|nr:NAD(P)/FAD-dependent oxidoreductase [Rhizomicrobium sp.]
MTAAYDAIVIGAGVNGLAAASYLAVAGKRVLVLEARDVPGGLANGARTLYALDPRVVRDLKLARRGLRFAVRDTPLVGLRSDGRHVVLARDNYASARSLAVHSTADAEAWPEFRRERFALARTLRPLWWRADSRATRAVAENARVRRLARLGTSAWLDTWFESDAVKAALGIDAHALSPLATGSALLLVWRAAQEMSGLQSATALPRSDGVMEAFVSTARIAGVETRMASPVSDVLVDRDGAVRGVALLCGDVVSAPLVMSSLSRCSSLSFPSPLAALAFGERAALANTSAGVQAARVTLTLAGPPAITGSPVPRSGRFVVGERLESFAAAHAAARAGRLPEELTMEVTFPAAADPAFAPKGRHLISALVAPLPRTVVGGWRSKKPLLAAKVVAALARHITHLSENLTGIDVLTPEEVRASYGADDAFGGVVDVTRLLADWRARVETPIRGLVLCGAAADPVGAVSGRGGRIAAAYVLETEGRR